MSELTPTAPPGGDTVLLSGVGNIGSHGTEHLARDPSIRTVKVADHDHHSQSNVTSQAITPDNVGRAKSIVQAERLRTIRGDGSLTVIPFVATVQDVPLGQLRADVCLGALDSRFSRRELNRICWRLGMPWVDAGVDSAGLLARINVYVPGDKDAPCLECGFNDRDYENLEHLYSCTGQAVSAPPTQGISSLGALAASMQVIEARKLLAHEDGSCARHQQVMIDARWHKYYVTTLRRNPNCRFDHQIWLIEMLPHVETLGDLMQFCANAAGAGDQTALLVEEKSWVTELVCGQCGHHRQTLRLQGRFGVRERRCGKCGGEMLPVAFRMLSQLQADAVPARWLKRSLRSLGLRAGDVLTSRGGDGDRHWEICD